MKDSSINLTLHAALIGLLMLGAAGSCHSSDSSERYKISTDAWGDVFLSVKECKSPSDNAGGFEKKDVFGVSFYLKNADYMLERAMANNANGSIFVFSSKENEKYGMTVEVVDESVDKSKFDDLYKAFEDAKNELENKQQSFFLRKNNYLYNTHANIIWVDQFYGSVSNTTVIFKNSYGKRVQVTLFPARGCDIFVSQAH